MGIPPDQLPHIFGRFWQADTSSQRKFQGMGIGLGLVKELSEVQGGGVSVVSAVGVGTTMTVRLPLTRPDFSEVSEIETDPDSDLSDASGPAPQNDWIAELYRRAELFPAMTSLQATLRPVETGISHNRKPKLLIADDEPDMLRFLKSQLSVNFEVLEAVDGQQAVEKAAQFLPDIILSDMMMPEKDGLQVCRELRGRTSTRSIPVVLLTARADERTKIECLAAGASDFLSKPFSLTEVLVRLKNLADSRLYQKELYSQKQQLEAALEQIKETESMLVQNEKLAALGRLSAGLIHEINNPLNYARQGLHILGRSGKLLPEGEQPDFNETLKDIEEGVNRVVQIVSDLRGYTRDTRELNQAFELKNLVETGLRFFSHIWKEGVQREVTVAEGLEVRGNANQCTQVFINLVQNALDAMETKDYPEGESPMISIHGERRGDKIVFTLRDNGPGIPAGIRDKVFDPFFTTKDVGKGMGLGLSICNRIIADHGGRVEVRSEPGIFTEFILEFPSVENPDFT
jgi:signal transduction histidine kinase